ncbi:MAG: D-isomer specific 2-hydroxyacid dehydrogenase family protein [Oscillospiraceae bacterium]
MFQKLVAIEPTNMIPSAEEKLHQYAKEVVLFRDIPADNAEMIQRIGNADAVLISYTSRMDASVIAACPNLRYVGMCCSLYSEASANVDIPAARSRNITVTGIRDYGDPGVAEYVVSQLVNYLHGFGGKRWGEKQRELTNLKVGIVGLGTTGMLIAHCLQAFDADLSYFSRTRKPDCEQNGLKFLPLEELLRTVDVVCLCLNKNAILLGEEQFAQLGNHKIVFNTSIGPGHDIVALEKWLSHGDNEFFCDNVGGVGSPALLDNPHVNCVQIAAGSTAEATARLSDKVLANIDTFLKA